MSFIHDRAPTNQLNVTFVQRWIDCGEPQTWSSRSPNFNPLDYFFWGYPKSIVNATLVVDEDDLRNRNANCSVICNIPGILERTR